VDDALPDAAAVPPDEAAGKELTVVVTTRVDPPQPAVAKIAISSAEPTSASVLDGVVPRITRRG
jgi:hypothetical protein